MLRGWWKELIRTHSVQSNRIKCVWYCSRSFVVYCLYGGLFSDAFKGFKEPARDKKTFCYGSRFVFSQNANSVNRILLCLTVFKLYSIFQFLAKPVVCIFRKGRFDSKKFDLVHCFFYIFLYDYNICAFFYMGHPTYFMINYLKNRLLCLKIFTFYLHLVYCALLYGILSYWAFRVLIALHPG